MKFEVSVDYIDPIELGEYEHVTVRLPDGRSVTVFADMIYIATEKDVIGHKDGQKIWEKGSPERSPYGLVRALKE
jgi:hypothetical protein